MKEKKVKNPYSISIGVMTENDSVETFIVIIRNGKKNEYDEDHTMSPFDTKIRDNAEHCSEEWAKFLCIDKSDISKPWEV